MAARGETRRRRPVRPLGLHGDAERAWERPAEPRGSYGIALKATKETVRLPLYGKGSSRS